MVEQNPYLLSRDVEPVHYSIELRPDLTNFTFSGSERVVIDIKKPTPKITLHALDIKIKNATIYFDRDNPTLKAKHIAFNKKMETVTLDFEQLLESGRAELALEFVGELNDKMHGFYRTSYEARGSKQWGAATQFEATDARRAFPCWDEPDRKATFIVTLVVPSHLVALSNMPIDSEITIANGCKAVLFQKTPKMSTYLLAFVVADLECIEATDRNGIPICVWTTPAKKEHGRFALECALHTLPYFAEWFGIPYAFPKLDMVALPDFAAGAMENWGLVTYRETALLFDPENSAAAARERIAEVVNHELAHMWFGNYTTMQWWTDLWLNEGFASYMGPKATNHHFPEWDRWTQYVADEYLGALHEDGLKNTHPVEIPVKHPAEINEVFDAISYSKGSVVNRMLNHYLGEEKFQEGLHLYLTRHAYGNAVTDDLWQVLEEVSGKPVRKIMASYTRQPGYPVITVREEAKKEKLILRLEQKRFIFDGSRDKKNLLWTTPVGVLTPHTEEPIFEDMTESRKTLSVSVSESDWLKLNPGQSGFYRVAYSEELWQRLIQAIEVGAMPTVDRLGLLDDAFALSRAGYMRTSSALTMLKVYTSEVDFSVWTVIASIFNSLDNLLSQENYKERFVVFAREFFRPIATAKGWDKSPSDGHLDILLRSLALRNLGGFGDTATIEEAKRRFDRFVRGEDLDPDLRQMVYSLVAENGREKEFEELLKIYKSTDLHEEKLRVLRSLGNCQDPELLKRLLGFSLSEDVRSQDTPLVLISTASQPLGRTLAWKFVKENWQTLFDRYGSGFMLLPRILGMTTSGFTTKEQLQDVKDFFQSHRVQGAKRTMKQSLETIRSNIAWLERDRGNIGKWLEANEK